ncbi:hypothetical protein FHR84_003935 [Actinopolyspora biskrensis]|uniref:HTH merR-type domain-containing protein n=1 Tax=Actinopolyspora biskrensis TaxID=1470178 RepID=A0A852Z4A1_9ACTN|nr:hypothetical protein [Actinopolyspora biskrensis]NYH80569.1 hypothetical protein [Actinopolyspora biskrensis]
MSGLPPKALRLYDELGLLPPAHVEAGAPDNVSCVVSDVLTHREHPVTRRRP